MGAALTAIRPTNYTSTTVSSCLIVVVSLCRIVSGYLSYSLPNSPDSAIVYTLDIS